MPIIATPSPAAMSHPPEPRLLCVTTSRSGELGGIRSPLVEGERIDERLEGLGQLGGRAEARVQSLREGACEEPFELGREDPVADRGSASTRAYRC